MCPGPVDERRCTESTKNISDGLRDPESLPPTPKVEVHFYNYPDCYPTEA